MRTQINWNFIKWAFIMFILLLVALAADDSFHARQGKTKPLPWEQQDK